MKSLKTILQCKWFYIILLMLSLIYTFIVITNNLIRSKYSNENAIIGIITDFKITNNKVSIILKAKEKILITYYMSKIKELDNFKDYKLGDRVKITGFLKKPSKNTVFNLFNYQNYLKNKKIFYLFEMESIEKIKDNKNILYSFKNNLTKYINKFQTRDYLNAFILGNNEIDENINNSYTINGVNHLFAISGMHITLFATILFKILKLMIKNEKIIYFNIFLFLLFYMFLVMFTPSVIRGVISYILINISKISKFKIKSQFILILIFSFLLFLNPYYIYSIGFQFTFVVSFYLIIFSKLINYYKKPYKKIFITSLIAFLAGLPITINNFFQVNLLTPLINIIFVPLISIIIFPLSLLTLLFPIFDNILLLIINFMEYLSLLIVKFDFFILILKHINYIGILIYYIFITFTLRKIYEREFQYIYYFIILLFLHNNINFLDRYPLITMIDVGQGDSLLIKLPHNKGNILIDTGGLINYKNEFNYKEYSIVLNKTIPYLKSLGIKKLDYLILTHGDNDHAKEANILYDNFKIQNIIINSGNINELEKTIVKNKSYLSYSRHTLNISNYSFHFINDIDYKNENEDSLIIYTNINGYNILLMGDAGIVSEKYLLNTYNLPKMDILKVGHHGSKNSSSWEFLNKIKPKISLISAGLNNRFNHPNIEVIENLNKINSDIYITNIHGSITLLFKNKIKIKNCFP